MYCPKCGKEIDDNANFCPFCGEEVSKKEVGIRQFMTLGLFGKLNSDLLSSFHGGKQKNEQVY